ncbi:MAG: hypothetical protein GC180_07320 [Bacteroidetes bacterium]|nr:hypothetical protein [Bacteroidota bacterium]
MPQINFLEISTRQVPADSYDVLVSFDGPPGSDSLPLFYNMETRQFDANYQEGQGAQSFSYNGSAGEQSRGITADTIDTMIVQSSGSIYGAAIIEKSGYPPPPSTSGIGDVIWENDALLNKVYLGNICLKGGADSNHWYISGDVLQADGSYTFSINQIQIELDSNNNNMQILSIEIVDGDKTFAHFEGIPILKSSLGESSPLVIIMNQGNLNFNLHYKKSGWLYLVS